jgi:hypothetical protein
MQDERDYREQQKQMDEQARGLEHEEPAKPHHNQDNCKYQKHERPYFLSTKESRAKREDYLSLREKYRGLRCLTSKQSCGYSRG